MPINVSFVEVKTAFGGSYVTPSASLEELTSFPMAPPESATFPSYWFEIEFAVETFEIAPPITRVFGLLSVALFSLNVEFETVKVPYSTEVGLSPVRFVTTKSLEMAPPFPVDMFALNPASSIVKLPVFKTAPPFVPEVLLTKSSPFEVTDAFL